MGVWLESADFLHQMELMLRIVLSGFCGGIIGYERESRKKEAGIRTHVIVAVSAALMMILSKYGFDDVLGEYVRLDPSRVAAGVVTAIGFLGSGVIFARNHNVSGLTTSAGIWATLGIGMSIGAGMYLIGITVAVIVIFVEIFLGRSGIMAYLIPEVCLVTIEYRKGISSPEHLLSAVREVLERNKRCRVLRFQIKDKESSMRLELLVRTGRGKDFLALAELTEKFPEIIKISA